MIQDEYGTLHINCPRCGGDWQESHSNIDYCACSQCDLIGFRESIFRGLVLSIKINESITVYWDQYGCQLSISSRELDHNQEYVYTTRYERFVKLPFDITSEKLKTYLIFS